MAARHGLACLDVSYVCQAGLSIVMVLSDLQRWSFWLLAVVACLNLFCKALILTDSLQCWTIISGGVERFLDMVVLVSCHSCLLEFFLQGFHFDRFAS